MISGLRWLLLNCMRSASRTCKCLVAYVLHLRLPLSSQHEQHQQLCFSILTSQKRITCALIVEHDSPGRNPQTSCAYQQ